LQSLCALGQQQLMAMDYLAAEVTLLEAERVAFALDDFDTLSRLYMPLQESRRQIRQRCGDGSVELNILASGPDDPLDTDAIVAQHPHAQLLVAGWGSIEPALRVRQLQSERRLYVETFLGAVYPMGASRAIAIVPLADVRLPDPANISSIDQLIAKLPPHSIVLSESDLPRGAARGNAQTYAATMGIWERLHGPFLATADMQVEPRKKIEGYRTAIRVDYACELAHQKLADVARRIAQTRAAISRGA
jgi:hypothetical protein